MSYLEPILSEIYSEIRFTVGSITDADLFDIVPALRDIGYPVTELQQGAGMLVEIAQKKLSPGSAFKVRCWAEDKQSLVQIASDKLLFNRIGDYLGWEVFSAQLRKVFDALNRVKQLEPVSVSLATIDKIETAAESYRFGTFLNCNGPSLPHWYEDSNGPADIIYGKGRLEEDGFNRQLKFTIRVDESNARIHIESVFANKLGDASELFDVLDDLHIESTQSFESIITDQVRELMNSK